MSQIRLVDSPNLYFSLPLLLLPLLILILIVKYFKASSKSLQIPPGPFPWPLVGNIFHMGKMPHVTLANLAKTHGPLISLRLGTQLMVVASSPVAAMEILKTHDRVLSGRSVPQSVPIKESEINNVSMGMALECGERWKFFRTICRTELFSAKALQAQEYLRERKVMEMVTYISRMEGMAVDIGEIVFTSIYNMLTNILLSKDIFNLEDDSGNEGIKGVIRTAMEIIATPNISDFYPILSRLDLQGLKKKSKEWCEKMNATWASTIKERKEKNGTGLSKDFLDVLIENNLTDDCINQLLQELLSAGSDTSSSTIEWTMAELIRSPESMKEIVQELDREIKQDVVEESHLPQLIYLQACIKETLRLHPPTPFLIPHRAQESCEVMNYAIPKNSKIMVNVWTIGRDSRYWEDPLEFKPVRFLDSSLDYKGTNFEYIPFGAGRRICPGLPMAAKQVSFVLASLLHFFDWSLPHGVDPKTLDMKEKFGLTLQKEQPLLLIPTPAVIRMTQKR